MLYSTFIGCLSRKQWPRRQTRKPFQLSMCHCREYLNCLTYVNKKWNLMVKISCVFERKQPIYKYTSEWIFSGEVFCNVCCASFIMIVYRNPSFMVIATSKTTFWSSNDVVSTQARIPSGAGAGRRIVVFQTLLSLYEVPSIPCPCQVQASG